MSFLPVRSLFVKNEYLPVCSSCKYYMPHPKVGKCLLFGEKNLETGEIVYLDVITCRKDETIGRVSFSKNCGSIGVHYEEYEKLY